MSKITLEFDVDDSDSFAKAKRALQADNLCLVISCFNAQLREIYKYSQDGFDEDTVTKLMELFHQTIEENCPSFYEIW